jgi:hypothetical protein
MTEEDRRTIATADISEALEKREERVTDPVRPQGKSMTSKFNSPDITGDEVLFFGGAEMQDLEYYSEETGADISAAIKTPHDLERFKQFDEGHNHVQFEGYVRYRDGQPIEYVIDGIQYIGPKNGVTLFEFINTFFPADEMYAEEHDAGCYVRAFWE